MNSVAVESREYAAIERKEIELSLRDQFPVTVKIKDNNKVVGTYRIVKTKNDGFMLQK